MVTGSGSGHDTQIVEQRKPKTPIITITLGCISYLGCVEGIPNDLQ